MKKIDDYTIGELKEIIQQREKKDWKEQAKGCYSVEPNSYGIFVPKYDLREHFYGYKDYEVSTLFAKKVDLFNRMNLFALIHNEGWVADWEDENQTKYGIVAGSYKDFSADYWNVSNFLVFGISVKSKEIAEKMLEEFRDELEIYLK